MTFPVLNAFCHLETKANPAWGLGVLHAQGEYMEHLQAVLPVCAQLASCGDTGATAGQPEGGGLG